MNCASTAHMHAAKAMHHLQNARRTRQAQQVASTSMQHHDLRTWHTQTAPNPDTIIWKNLGCAA